MFQLRLMSADICQKWYSEVSSTLLVLGLNSVLISFVHNNRTLMNLNITAISSSRLSSKQLSVNASAIFLWLIFWKEKFSFVAKIRQTEWPIVTCSWALTTSMVNRLLVSFRTGWILDLWLRLAGTMWELIAAVLLVSLQCTSQHVSRRKYVCMLMTPYTPCVPNISPAEIPLWLHALKDALFAMDNYTWLMTKASND